MAAAISWRLSPQREGLFTTPLIVAEIDHLVTRGGGRDAALAFYEDLASGAALRQRGQRSSETTLRES